MNNTSRPNFNYLETVRRAAEILRLTHDFPEHLIVEALGEELPSLPTGDDSPSFSEDHLFYEELLHAYQAKERTFRADVLSIVNGYTPKELVSAPYCE